MKFNTQFLDFCGKLSYNIDVESAGVDMIIKEQFIMGKSPDQSLCEDVLFVSDSFIAVLDGVTAKSTRKFNNMSGGKAATDIATGILKCAPANISKTELFRLINDGIKSLYGGDATGEAAVCMIVFSKFHKELWVVGDCQCIINGEHHTHEKLIDKELSEARSRVIKEALENGATLDDIAENDVGRQAIMPELSVQHNYANRTDHPYGYTVLNGTKFSEEGIVTYTLNDSDTVILATDGYPMLYDTLAQSEAYLSYILQTDPLCFNEHKSSKGLQKGNLSFDDRTYIKFIL